jgi:hypothetical protein
MKRIWIAAATSIAVAFAAPGIALAEDNQPSEGENSTGRNEAGFGGGPHCHFTFVRVFPSHTGHVHSGLGEEGPFIADGDCNGLP